MGKKQSIFWGSIIVILLLVIIFYRVRPHSRFLLSIFSPSDLYAPIVQQPISLKEKTVYPIMKLPHNYVGTYFVGIYLKKIPPYGTPIESKAELWLTISNEGGKLFEAKYDKWASRFGGPGKKEAGVILGFYKVPDNIPLGMSTKATIAVISSDTTFEEKYGELEFFIRRTVDQ